MEPEEFVREMDATLWKLLAVRDAERARLAETAGKAAMTDLLKAALRAEMDAAEIAALWVPTTTEVDVKLAFARQAGDEAKHYMLIADRLRELGVDLNGHDPQASGPNPLFLFLEGLSTSVERVAAAQLTREAIGYKSNELFIAYCEEVGDTRTAAMYRDEIQPDEWLHHEWGKRLLATLALNDSQQRSARLAILTTLERTDELRSLAVGRLVVETLPGC